MKMMKRSFALLLVLALALSLSACGSQGKELIGTWRFDIDYTGAMNQELGSIVGEDMPTDVPNLVIPVIITFQDNMVCTVKVDADGRASLMDYLDVLIDALIEFMYKQGEAMGVSREDMDAYMVESMGSDVATYCRQAMQESVDVESLMSDLEGEETGAWKVKDGKLYLQADEDGFDDNMYLEYTVADGKLTFTGDNGDPLGLQEALASFPYSADGLNIGYPMVFEKIG